MSEQLPAPNTLEYNVAVAINNLAWQERFKQHTDVINTESVMNVIDAINIHEIDEEGPHWERQIDSVGTLRMLDQSGESKVALHLETYDGKNMAVKMTNWLLSDERREPSAYAPEDPKMVKMKSGLGKDLYEYSDLETPLVVDTGQFELLFQEYGFQNLESVTRRPLDTFRNILRKARATKRMINHIRGNAAYKPAPDWLVGAKAELMKPRHQLLDASGNTVLIDVPIELLK